MFLDGDFDSKKGNCPHHCSPTCHPAQTGPDRKYGCRHPAWPQNKHGDFVPIVECAGIKNDCDLAKSKFLKPWKNGITRRIKNATGKIDDWQKLLDEVKDLSG